MEHRIVEEFFQLILIAVGVTYVIAGSKIGHPIRFVWCWILDKLRLSCFWSILICPPCNAWWAGFGVTAFYGHTLLDCLALAFASCGVVAAIQAVGLSIGLQAEEDYNELIPRRDKEEKG